MFGFIKNLAKRNDNNFFLELKEEVDSKVDDAKSKVADATSKAADAVTSKVNELMKDDEKDKQPAKTAALTDAKTTQSAPAPATASSNGKMTRKEAAAAAKASKIEAAKKARAEKEAAEAKPKDPSKLAAAKKTAEVQLPKETNFATKYLMTPSSNGRRRPGPNMNSFLEMASKVKTPQQK